MIISISVSFLVLIAVTLCISLFVNFLLLLRIIANKYPNLIYDEEEEYIEIDDEKELKGDEFFIANEASKIIGQ